MKLQENIYAFEIYNYLIFTSESRFLFFSRTVMCTKKDEKKREKKLIITNTRCDIVRWHTHAGVCVQVKKKRNQMVFILKYEKKNEDEKKKKSKIESCSFAILYTKKRIILSILSTIIVFFFSFDFIYIYIQKQNWHTICI